MRVRILCRESERRDIGKKTKLGQEGRRISVEKIKEMRDNEGKTGRRRE